MRSIPLHDYASLSAVELTALTASVQDLPTLADVLGWAPRQDPSWFVVEIVTQDEYTHDVVFEARGQPYLVFDTT